jgi:hypothetical protein
VFTSQCRLTPNPTLIYVYNFSVHSSHLKSETATTTHNYQLTKPTKTSKHFNMQNQIDTDFIAPLIFAAVLICGLGYDIFRYLRSDPDAFSWLPFRQRQPVEPEEIELLTIENEHGSEHEEGEDDEYDHPALQSRAYTTPRADVYEFLLRTWMVYLGRLSSTGDPSVTMRARG